MTGPLIVTLRLDAATQAYFDALRTRYFPPERLLVGAHVTMFHAIPATHASTLCGAIASFCKQTPAFSVTTAGVRFLGRGAAVSLAAPQAQILRTRISELFDADLTPQDRARWSPHVTVQNKVDPSIARRTCEILASLSTPAPMMACGIAVWEYDAGPWRPISDYPFLGQAEAQAV